MSSYRHIIRSSFHHMIHRAKTVSQFCSKISEKKLQSSFNPFAKERRDLNFWQVGVIFQGEFDGDAQNAPAFPKRGNHGSITKNLWKVFAKKSFLTSKNETSGIVWNIFWPSLKPILRKSTSGLRGPFGPSGLSGLRVQARSAKSISLVFLIFGLIFNF